MPRFSVQLQLHDGTPSRWLSQREADQKVATGEATRIRRKAHQPHNIVRLVPQPDPSTSRTSPCGITCSEMQVAAHWHSHPNAPPNEYIQDLRAKILEFKVSPLPVILVPA